MTLATQFEALYRGLQRAHGTYTTVNGRAEDKDKRNEFR